MRNRSDTWRRLLAAWSVLTMLAVGGSLALAQEARVSGLAWIDQPLAFEPIQLERYEVIAHVTDTEGVVVARLDVNGVTVAQKDLDGKTISIVEFSWLPPGPGAYELEVFGRNSAGAWGRPGVVTALVGLASPLPRSPIEVTTTTTLAGSTTTTLQTTTTQQGGSTTSTTTSPTTTTTVCVYPAPVPGTVQPGRVAGAYTLNWSYNGCTSVPFSFLIHVSLENNFPAQRTDSHLAAGGARSLSISGYPCPGPYFWRISVVDPDGSPLSPWSNVASFGC